MKFIKSVWVYRDYHFIVIPIYSFLFCPDIENARINRLEIERKYWLCNHSDLCYSCVSNKSHTANIQPKSNCLFGRRKKMIATMCLRPIKWFAFSYYTFFGVFLTKLWEMSQWQMGASSENCLIWKIEFGFRSFSVHIHKHTMKNTVIPTEMLKFMSCESTFGNIHTVHSYCFHSLRLWCNTKIKEKKNYKRKTIIYGIVVISSKPSCQNQPKKR